MSMKRQRQELLLRLISEHEIETQDELIAKLREHGWNVTQATVSRDIREMKLAKITTAEGVYRYVSPRSEHRAPLHFSTPVLDLIVHIDHACNLVVLKTHAGMAQAVAVGVDNLNMSQVLGCVAGDDTIMIAARDAEGAAEIADRLATLRSNKEA